MKLISSLHYITQETPGKTHWQMAEEACQAGVDWVQLRIKNHTDEACLDIASKTKSICDKYGSKLIINDRVLLAKTIGADGIHLGKTDMDVTEARSMVGNHMIIGGTANTLNDIILAHRKGVDYIGLGPYRFTTTKEKLSPILGLNGYEALMIQCAQLGIDIPIVAIGGILPEDVASLIETGIHGIAIGGAIGLADDKHTVVATFKEQLKRPHHEPDHRR